MCFLVLDPHIGPVQRWPLVPLQKSSLHEGRTIAAGANSFLKLVQAWNSCISDVFQELVGSEMCIRDRYWANVRVQNKKTHTVEYQPCAFLLPHEYVELLHRLGDTGVLCSTAGLDPLSHKHLVHCKAMAGAAAMAPLGFWGDGVPVNWDRSESVETFSINLPGQCTTWKSLRLPVTGFSRKLLAPGTWDDLMSVVSWSFQVAALGVWPSARRDGSDWLPSDCHRRKKHGNFLKSCLVEVRGDWKFYGETFGFPKWNSSAGMCWKCTCTPAQVIM